MTASKLATVDALADRLLRLALGFPFLLLMLLLASFAATPANAEDAAGAQSIHPTCGTDLFASLSEEQKAEVREKAADTPAGDSRFWTIERPGADPSYLLGTFHTADRRVTTLPTPIRTKFDDADTLAVEIVEIGDPAKSAAAVFSDYDRLVLPAGETIATLVGEDRLERLETMLDGKGLALPLVERLQPWFLAMSLAAPTCEAMQVSSPGEVLDGLLVTWKSEDGGEVVGLETMNEQLDLLAGMPMDLQIEQLTALADFGGHMNDVMETMVQRYLDGEIAAIMPTLEAAFPNGGMLVGAGESSAAFETSLIDDRNRTMVDRMIPLLETGNAFVAVGALHLPGTVGIVELLRERGWTVTKAG